MNLSKEFEAIAEKNAKTLVVKYDNDLAKLTNLKFEISGKIAKYREQLCNLHKLQRTYKEAINFYAKNLKHTYLQKMDQLFDDLAYVKTAHQAVRKVHDENVIYLRAIEMTAEMIVFGAKKATPINAKPKKTLTIDRKDAYKMLKKLVDFYKNKDQQTIEFDLETM